MTNKEKEVASKGDLYELLQKRHSKVLDLRDKYINLCSFYDLEIKKLEATFND